MSDPKPAEAKTCVHTWSDRDWRGRRMDDGVLCAKCGRLSHWYRIVREQAERIAKLQTELEKARAELITAISAGPTHE